jgi:hypothetical protein
MPVSMVTTMDKQVYLQPWRCIQIEGSLQFASFPAVNAKMKCQEYPNAQDGNPEAWSRDQILTPKASNTPPAKILYLEKQSLYELDAHALVRVGACDDRMKSRTVCMIVKTNYKCTCTRRNSYCDYATGWSIEESCFDSPQGHLTLHFPNLARPALESSQNPNLSAQEALIMVAKQPGRAIDYPHPSSAESKNAWNYTSTHTYLHRVVGYEVREQFLPLQDQ